jgi:hypothetical protein
MSFTLPYLYVEKQYRRIRPEKQSSVLGTNYDSPANVNRRKEHLKIEVAGFLTRCHEGSPGDKSGHSEVVQLFHAWRRSEPGAYLPPRKRGSIVPSHITQQDAKQRATLKCRQFDPLPKYRHLAHGTK